MVSLCYSLVHTFPSVNCEHTRARVVTAPQLMRTLLLPLSWQRRSCRMVLYTPAVYLHAELEHTRNTILVFHMYISGIAHHCCALLCIRCTKAHDTCKYTCRSKVRCVSENSAKYSQRLAHRVEVVWYSLLAHRYGTTHILSRLCSGGLEIHVRKYRHL